VAPEVCEERRRLVRAGMIGGGALATCGLGAALLALMPRPAFADQAMDVQMLQTSASLENLAVATYVAALSLPFIGGSSANAMVRAFATRTRDQHAAHARALNAAITQLGGKAQPAADPVLSDVVDQAKATLSGLGPVVDLASRLETAAAQTYAHNLASLSDLNARNLTASIMGVEAQHVAVLNVVRALVTAGVPQLIALDPSVVGGFPAAVGSAGSPDSFMKTDQARPPDEGAVR